MQYSMVALEKEKLRAAAKSSIHGKSYTLSVNSRAISRVRSVEPVSTMMISSATGLALSRQRAKTSSSFLTIMHKLTVIIGKPPICHGDGYQDGMSVRYVPFRLCKRRRKGACFF